MSNVECKMSILNVECRVQSVEFLRGGLLTSRHGLQKLDTKKSGCKQPSTRTIRHSALCIRH